MEVKRHILIVEDSPTMRQLLVFALRRIKDCEIVEAQDGLDGLGKLRGGNFDLLFADINMPIMDGLKMIGIIRADARYSDLPICVITNEAAPEDRARALRVGANEYLVKPIQANKVLAITKRYLKIE